MKPNYDKLLSNFAFKFNQRHYRKGVLDGAVWGSVVGLCRLTPGSHN